MPLLLKQTSNANLSSFSARKINLLINSRKKEWCLHSYIVKLKVHLQLVTLLKHLNIKTLHLCNVWWRLKHNFFLRFDSIYHRALNSLEQFKFVEHKQKPTTLGKDYDKLMLWAWITIQSFRLNEKMNLGQKLYCNLT